MLLKSSTAQLSSKEDFEQAESSHHCYSREGCISNETTLLDQQSAHHHSSDQKNILKEQSDETTVSVVSIAYGLWLPFFINRVVNLRKKVSLIRDLSGDSSCFAL